MKKNLLTPLYTFLLLCISILFIQCKKNDEVDSNYGSNIVLQFSVSGIAKANSTNFKSGDRSADSPLSNVIHRDYETYETLNYFQADVPTSTTFKNGNAQDSMKSNVRYRVEIFEVNSSNEIYVATLNLLSGATGENRDTVSVIYGKNYKWYAYSYNSTEEISNPNGSIDVPMGENKDFLYKSGTISNKPLGRTSIDIVFERKTSRIAIDVDVRGANADEITALQVNLPTNIFKTGNINLKSPNEVILADFSNSSISLGLSDFANVDGVGNDYRKVAYLHSATNLSVQSPDFITVNYQSLTYVESNGIIGEGRVDSIRNRINIPLKFSNVSIDKGQSGSLKADFLAKGISVGSVQWAPANLYMHDLKFKTSNSKHRYRFYPHNNPTRDYRTFFSFQGIVPLHYSGFGGIRTKPVDVCNWVYPYKRWKTPIRTNFTSSSLVSSSGLVGNVLNLLTEILSLGTNQLDAVADFSPASLSLTYNNMLKVPMNNMVPSAALLDLNLLSQITDGYLIKLNLFRIMPSGVGLNIMPTDPLGGYHSAHLWSMDELVDLDLLGLNILDVGAQSYFGLIKEKGLVPLLDPEIRKAAVTSDLTNISALGSNQISILKSNFKNIRCVRNNNWETIEILKEGYNPDPTYNFEQIYLNSTLLNLGANL